MLKQVDQLHAIAHKNKRRIIGLMSGTSLDGLDVALCEVEGHGRSTSVTLKAFATVPYDAETTDAIRAIFSKETIAMKDLCMLNAALGRTHAAMINSCLNTWKICASTVDLVASHGQTVYHAPADGDNPASSTLQISDADHIAFDTGIITVSDFRQKHIAAGGEGAPLAGYGDYLLCSDTSSDIILLNIGGIANFTFIRANAAFADCIVSDVAPGNCIMDAFILKQLGIPFDPEGMHAGKGAIHPGLLEALTKNSFFDSPLPKTTGPELFNLAYLEAARKRSGTTTLADDDVLATLNRFSAEMISRTVLQTGIDRKGKVYISGGGLHNLCLVQNLEALLPGITVTHSRELGIDPDAKEAVLFAILANECICGDKLTFEPHPEKTPAVSMGKISFPR